MKIKYNKFWKHIGDIFMVKEDIKVDDDILLPKGTYQIFENHPDGFEVYDIQKGEFFFIEGLAPDIEFIEISSNPEEKLEIMTEATLKQILQLSNEGWKISDNDYNYNEKMDITPYIQKYKILKVLQEAVNKGQ